MAYAQMGCALCMSAKYEECFSFFDQAVQLGSKDPMLYLSVMGRTFAHFFREDYEAAADWAKRPSLFPTRQYGPAPVTVPPSAEQDARVRRP